MTPQEQTEAILARIRECCPELMELSFGCVVALKNTRRWVLYGQKFPSKKFWKNDDSNRWENENGYIDSTEMTSLIMNDDVHIIGHPVRLEHLLRAVMLYTVTTQGYTQFLTEYVRGDLLTKPVRENLEKNEELRKFIYSLICKV